MMITYGRSRFFATFRELGFYFYADTYRTYGVSLTLRLMFGFSRTPYVRAFALGPLTACKCDLTRI